MTVGVRVREGYIEGVNKSEGGRDGGWSEGEGGGSLALHPRPLTAHTRW